MGRHALADETAPGVQDAVVDRSAVVAPAPPVQYRTRAEARAAEREAEARAAERDHGVRAAAAPSSHPVPMTRDHKPGAEVRAAEVRAVQQHAAQQQHAAAEQTASEQDATAPRRAQAGRVAARPAVRRVGGASRPVVVARPRTVTRAADVRPAPHVRRTMSAQRLALIVAPVIAMTSAITFAMPANAATVSDTTSSFAAPAAQHYRVSTSIEVPEIDNGTTTIVSYPSVVMSGGATVAEAQAAIGAALSAGGQRAQVLQTALSYLGTPYVEGGASHASIDCSGLTMVAYASVGIPLVHYVPTQDAAATTIPDAEALPGDLVVYDNQDHVGIFLGNGLVLQAPHPGATVDIVPMYSAAHHFARLLPAS